MKIFSIIVQIIASTYAMGEFLEANERRELGFAILWLVIWLLIAVMFVVTIKI